MSALKPCAILYIVSCEHSSVGHNSSQCSHLYVSSLLTQERGATHHFADKLYVNRQNCRCAHGLQYLHN